MCCMSTKNRFTFSFVVLAFVVLATIGCGRKAPPVVPKQKPLTAITDLKGGIDQRYVQLSWSHNPENWQAEEYVILEAQELLTQKQCPGCPLAYLKIGAVRISEPFRKKKHEMVFSKEVSTGYRYTYQVRPVSATDAQGPDSNLVMVEITK